MNIEFKNISKQYKRGTLALDNVNLSFGNGVFGLLGRNGAGKTTLMSLLATIIKPTSGQILFDSKLVEKDGAELRSRLGFLPQNTSLHPNLTVYEYLDYIALLKEIKDKKERQRQIKYTLEIVGLENCRKKKLREFSGGMLRRAGIAQMLLGDPELLIIDEPTAGLDPEERLYFKNLLSKIGRSKTVLLSTHIISDIQDICNNLAILELGKIKYSGNTSNLIRTVDNMTWEVDTEKEENIEEIKKQGIVTAITYNNPLIKIRYISAEKVTSLSEKKEGTLEDAYIFLAGGMQR